MKQILRWALTGALLAGLYAGIAAAAAHDIRRVEVAGSTGIDIRGSGGHVVIGNGEIRITDHAKSIVIARHQPRCPSGQEIVKVGHSARLPAGRTACDVVTVFGDSSVHGTVSDSVVAVMGSTRVSGNVANSVVTVFGNGHIDGRVGGNVVTIFGNQKLGPKAIVQGQAVSLFGAYERNRSAAVQGGTVQLMSGIFRFTALRGWGEHCLLFGRLLAPRRDVLWAWGVALSVLAIYLLLAALFRDGLRHCVRTLEEHPGPAILTALAMVLLTPILMLVLMFALTVTVVGILFVPLLWFGLLCAGIFGRLIAIAWLGGRILRGAHRGADQPVLNVLVGGALVSVLYMVPVVGFIVFAAIGLIGFGTLTYTLLLALRSARGAVAQPADPPAMGSAPPPRPGAAPGDATREAAAMSAGPVPGPTASAAPAEPTPFELMALPRAGFWIRMAALLIDLVLISVCLSLIGHHGSGGTLIALAIYGALMWKLRGTTVGGIICHLRVTRIDGRPLSWETAILRALGCFLSLVAAGLGFFWIAFDAERQAWHDKIAGTVVVSVPKVRGLV